MNLMNDNAVANDIGKVPAVTLGFWIIKILATTLGETGGDAVTMSMDLGYLVGTAIFAAAFAVAVAAQMAASISILGRHRRHHDRRHDIRRLRRSIARHRLSRRLVSTRGPARCVARNLVPNDGVGLDRIDQQQDG